MGDQASIQETPHTTHVGTIRLTLDQAARLWKSEDVPEADPTDAPWLLLTPRSFEPAAFGRRLGQP